MEFNKPVIYYSLIVLVTLLDSCVDSSHVSNRFLLSSNLQRWRSELLKNAGLTSGKIVANVKNVGLIRTVNTVGSDIANHTFNAPFTTAKRRQLKQSDNQNGSDAVTTTVQPTPLQTTTVQPNIVRNTFPTAAVIAAIATAIAVSVAVSVSQVAPPIQNTFDFSSFSFTPTSREIPEVHHDMSVRGFGFPDDGCGDFSVRFDDDQCHSILRGGPCGFTQWVTVNPQTLRGQCTPRLCGRQRVYIGRNELCHDVYDPSECRGGRRLFYSAYGDPICDCPIGQYAFPTPQDDCVPLFTQGPCPAGFQVTIVPGGDLGCTPAAVPPIDADNSRVQRVVTNDGRVFVLGSRGPCSSTSQILGYDIFKREIQCVDTSDPTSPYFSSTEEEALLDQIFHQFYPDYNEILPVMIYRNSIESNALTDSTNRRQGENTIGVLQVPSVLLAPCRTGARRELNFKCVNPIIPERRPTEILPAVQSRFRCARTLSLKVTGQCVPSSAGNSCGPSFQFSPETGQCRFRNMADNL